MLKPGRYRHYKGGVYTVLFVAQDSESALPVVVYMNEAHGSLYVRLYNDFVADVLVDATVVPRFTPVNEN